MKGFLNSCSPTVPSQMKTSVQEYIFEQVFRRTIKNEVKMISFNFAFQFDHISRGSSVDHISRVSSAAKL